MTLLESLGEIMRTILHGPRPGVTPEQSAKANAELSKSVREYRKIVARTVRRPRRRGRFDGVNTWYN